MNSIHNISNSFLEQNDQMADFILNEMNFSVLVLDFDLKIKFCNTTFRSIFSENALDEIYQGAPISGLLTPSSLYLLERKIALLENEIEESFDLEFSVDNQFYQFQVTPKGIFKNGELDGSFFIMKNISGQVQVNSSLSISDDILEQIGSIVIVGDCNSNILYCTPSIAQILGYNSAKILNNGWWNHTYLNEEDANTHKSFLSQLISDTKVEERAPYERKVICNDGSHKWLLCKDTRGPVGLFITVAHDISELKKAHESLEVSQNDLAEKNKELDTFVYKASHDLKGPLASIIGLCNIYKNEYSKSPGHEIMDMINKSTEKLDSILNDLLRVSRMNHNDIKWSSIAFDDMLNEILDQLKYASAKEVVLDIKPKNIVLKSDASLLYSIFQNLVSNSIKYQSSSVDKVEVNINIKEEDDQFKIHYSDNGIGIKPALCESIFDMFFRAHEDQQGTGLGLYIVKQSIKKLGGQIYCKSQINEGVHFYINLKK